MKKVNISNNVVIDLFSRIELVRSNDRLIPKNLLSKDYIYRCLIPIRSKAIDNINIFLSNDDMDYINNKIDSIKETNKITNIHLSNLIVPEERYMFKSSTITKRNILFKILHNNFLQLDIKLIPLHKGKKLDNILIYSSISYQFLFLKYRPRNMQPKPYKISSSDYEDIQLQLKCI